MTSRIPTMLSAVLTVLVCVCSSGTPLLAEQATGSALASGTAFPDGYAEMNVAGSTLTGRFVDGDGEVSWEIRRGSPTPREIRRLDPSAPRYEIDIRLMDELGRVFFAQYGGHGPLDESWVPESKAAMGFLGPPTDQEARRNFANAERAIAVLDGVSFSARYRPERDALMALMPLMRELRAINLVDDVAEPDKALSTCTYRNRVEVRYKPFLAPLAQHSAVLATNISVSGQTTSAWNSCNHGTCASQMSSRKCSWTSSANRCNLPGPTAGPECGTPYGYTCSKHVCNDDTYVQVQSVKLYASPVTSTCRDCTLRSYAPGC